MSEKSQLLFMQTRLLRLATNEWNMPMQAVLEIFKRYNVFKYIDVGFGIFHCEGDYAVLEDIESYLDRKGYKFNV